MLGEAAQSPGKVLAPAVKALQPVCDIDSKGLIVLPRGAVCLVPYLSQPPEACESCHLAQNDHREREQHETEESDGRPTDPIVAGDQRQRPIVEPERGDQADRPAKSRE